MLCVSARRGRDTTARRPCSVDTSYDRGGDATVSFRPFRSSRHDNNSTADARVGRGGSRGERSRRPFTPPAVSSDTGSADDAGGPARRGVLVAVDRGASPARRPRVRAAAEAAGRRARGGHDARGRGPVLRDDAGRHGRGRGEDRAARVGRRQPRLRAAVRGRARRPRPAQPLLRLAEPEQAERVRGLPAARGQGRGPRAGAAVARARRELHTRHVGQVS